MICADQANNNTIPIIDVDATDGGSATTGSENMTDIDATNATASNGTAASNATTAAKSKPKMKAVQVPKEVCRQPRVLNI